MRRSFNLIFPLAILPITACSVLEPNISGLHTPPKADTYEEQLDAVTEICCQENDGQILIMTLNRTLFGQKKMKGYLCLPYSEDLAKRASQLGMIDSDTWHIVNSEGTNP